MRLPTLSPYDVDSLTFARKERIGNTRLFVGREEELNSLIKWALQIPREMSKSNALLARRKKGKTAILERMFNYIYTLNTNLVPFYFEVKEDDVWINHFAEDFYRGFVSQYLGFKLKNLSLIRKPPEFAKLKELSRQNQLTVLEEDINAFENLSKRKDAGPLMWHHAAAAPQAIASVTGDFILQIIDEFQFLNSKIFLDKKLKQKKEDIPGIYLSVAESKVAPILAAGSWVGWLMSIIRLQLPARFTRQTLPNFKPEEGLHAVVNYSNISDVPVTDETACLINRLCYSDPFYISAVIRSQYKQKDLTTPGGVLKTLEYEVLSPQGDIHNTWLEYIQKSISQVNDKYARKIILFLLKNPGKEWSSEALREELKLPYKDKNLHLKLDALEKGDLILEGSTLFSYRGVTDEIFEKVVRHKFGDQIEKIPQELENRLKEENKRLRGKLNYYKGHWAEFLILNFLRHEAHQEPDHLKDRVYNYKEGTRFREYKEVKSHMFKLADGRVREIDVYAVCYDEPEHEINDLAFEVKNRETRKTGPEEVNVFVRKLEDLRQTGRPIEGIFYSASGFTEEAVKKLEESNLMYTDYDRWWGSE